MIEGTTKSGFHFRVSRRVRNDWKFVEALADSESKDESDQLRGMVNIVRLLFKDQAEALYTHIQEEDGTVPTDKLMEETREVLEAMQEKNS